MSKLLKRHMTSELKIALESARIVNLVGPRQAGKTTLVRDLLGYGQFYTLDDENVLKGIENDAYGMVSSVLNESTDFPVIIDEAQRSPALPLALKRIVDANRKKGQFLLTGSANIFQFLKVTDSLAGRIYPVNLPPLTSAEIFGVQSSKLIEWALESSPSIGDIRNQDFSRSEVIDLVLRGGFPEIRELELKQRTLRYSVHLDQIVERDVASLLNLRKPDSFRQLINQMAVRTANELNVSSLSSHLNISRATIEQYLDILLRLNIIIKLDAWTSGEQRRDIKNPKYHFVDSGIACAIRGFNEQSFKLGFPPANLGSVFESYVVNELLRTLPFLKWNVRVFHWRDSNFREIDMIIEKDNSLVGIEIKASTTIHKDAINNMLWFTQIGPGRNHHFTGLIIYLGNQIIPFGDRIFAIPVSALWSQI